MPPTQNTPSGSPQPAADLRTALAEAHKLLAAGRPHRAEALLRPHVNQQPHNAELVRPWCSALLAGGDVRGAIPLLKKTIAAGVPDLLPRFCLAVGHQTNGNLEAAHEQLDSLLSVQPDMVQAIHLKTRILVMQRRYEQASQLFENVNVEGHPLLAGSFALFAPMVGRRDEAIAHLEKVVAEPKTPPAIAYDIGLTLARLLDKAERYDEAMAAAQQANRLVPATYQPEAAAAEVEQLLAQFSAERVQTQARASGNTSRPIFIVGMPRSGTSLVEAILNEHSQVGALGESTVIPRLRPMDLTNQEVVDTASRAVLDAYQQLEPSHARLTDKQLDNHRALGVLQAILPGSRVIWCRRDPRDVAISCFFQTFQTGANWSHDLEHIAHHQQLYDRVMQHMCDVLDLKILPLEYEQLVQDPRGEVARILEHVGLDWQDSCLNFADSKRVTLTQSNQQVQQNIYTTSVSRFQHYASAFRKQS